MKFLTEREFYLPRLKHIDMMRNYKTTRQDTGHEEKRPFGRLWRRWKDNINMVLKKIVWDGIDWSDVTQEREKWPAVVNTVMNIRLAKNARIFFTA
jgi:hypothetical protein